MSCVGDVAVPARLAVLLGEPAPAPTLSREEMEKLLTEGYALALDVEVERHRLVARLSALIEDSGALQDASQVAQLRREIVTLGRRAQALRARLAAVRERHGLSSGVTGPTPSADPAPPCESEHRVWP